MTRFALVLVASIVAALAVIVGALAIGSVEIEFDRFLAALTGRGDDAARAIIWELRAPRVLAAFAAGALLALAGTVLQVLLRNPLADPYILGVSGGASVGALLAMLLGGTATGVAIGAIAGAGLVAAALGFFALGLTYGMVARLGFDPLRVLLAGAGFAAAGGALVSLILSLSPAEQLPGMLFWLMGDLADARDSRLAWLVLILAVVTVMVMGDSIDLLGLGPAKAASLGVAVARTQWIALIVALVATACAVLVAGGVGFVGLAVPQALRLLGIHQHRQLAPMAVLLGGTLLVAADAMGRTIARPIELPVGAMTTLVGVPVLLYLIRRSR